MKGSVCARRNARRDRLEFAGGQPGRTSTLRAMFRRPPNSITLGCALVGAFLIGRFTADHRPGAVAPGAGVRAAPAAAQNVSSEPSDEGGRKPAGDVLAAALADAAGKSVEEHARLIVTQKPGLARTALLESLLERVTADNWLAVFEVMWRAREEGMISEREQHWFLQRAGAVGGAAAAERFKPKDPVKDWDTHSGRQAMRGWAQADTAAALAWLDAQPAGNYRTGMADGFVRGLAADDPEVALRVMGTLVPDQQRQLMNALLNLEDAPHYVPFAQDWLTSGALDAAAPESMQIKAQVFGNLIEAEAKALWNDRDGTRLAQWAEKFAGREFVSAQALQRLAGGLDGHMAAPGVIELLERMSAPELPVQGNPVGGVMQRWARQDSDAAAQWLNDHTDSPSYAAAVIAFVHSVPEADPAARRAWIETLHDEALRTQLQRQLDEAQKAARSGQ